MMNFASQIKHTKKNLQTILKLKKKKLTNYSRLEFSISYFWTIVDHDLKVKLWKVKLKGTEDSMLM